ncbi:MULTISPECIES: carbonic anhydrase family protein [unclassified Legionella]|uniref:carbonic anhydrase family protein n=1 Tax=unclassified Legionella TaxID=2622702 RepID=UPI001054EE14|nr:MULTISPECIES: carbonic anhydrase family protein [unclassified Legionella]MDI9818477.1 carbonic anhydrase family protein [Legionella sp. PL877]
MYTLTKEQQQRISPKQAIELLKAGNRRFVSNLKINRNLLQQVNETSQGQHPFAAVLSCMDSRTPAELIFDQGLGDIFSLRIAGNILNDDIVGSLEFACDVVGAKLIAVVGHSGCGAIQGACNGVELGYLSQLLHKIGPVIEKTKTSCPHLQPDTPEFMQQVTRLNIKHTAEEISSRSNILNKLLSQQKIAIIGGLYNIDNGEVEFFDNLS